ncbi:MAG: signal peptidase II [Thermoleophilia bacterium]|nr:signal peptidase II [Thermoleophilia bacterium]
MAPTPQNLGALLRSAGLKWLLLIVSLAATLSLDLWTKRWAERELALGEMREILPFLYLERTRNSGMAFGLLGGKTAFIAGATIVAILIVCAYVFLEKRRVLAGVAGGAVLGGSLGNLVQRLSGDGHVTDFLKFPHWPNFNLADVFVDAGIAVIFLGIVVQFARSWRVGRKSQVNSDAEPHG